MHIERNIYSSLLEYTLGEQDAVAVRRDMEEAGTMQHLWPRRQSGSKNYIKPQVSYMLSKGEKVVFLYLFSTI